MSLNALLLLSALFLTNCPPVEAATLRHLYLTLEGDPTTSVVINAHVLNSERELYLYFDTTPHFSNLKKYSYRVPLKLREKLSFTEPRHIFQTPLTNLESATTYYFTIGDAFSSLCAEKKFQTLDLCAYPLVFIEGGDCETTAAGEKLVKISAEHEPSLYLLGGDYPSNVIGLDDYKKWDQWLDIYADKMVRGDGALIPLVLAIGNHEVRGGFKRTREEAPFFFRYFKQSPIDASFFSLNIGDDIKILILDSGHIESHSGSQLIWLEKELMEARQKRIKIALYHVPIYPSCRFEKRDGIYYSCYGLIRFFNENFAAHKLYSKESAEGRKHWAPLFDAWNLTVAFEHHDQALKRTKLLKDGAMHPQGTLYLGDGGFGPKLQYPPLQGFVRSHFAEIKGKVHFFWKMEIFPTFIRYSAINSSNKIIDCFEQKL